jgi:hypothetical protein
VTDHYGDNNITNFEHCINNASLTAVARVSLVWSIEKQHLTKYILLIKNVKYKHSNLFSAQHSETIHKQQQL